MHRAAVMITAAHLFVSSVQVCPTEAACQAQVRACIMASTSERVRTELELHVQG